MAVATPWIIVHPDYALKADGVTPCSDGDDVYFVTDISGNGATIVPDSTNRPKIKVQGTRKRFFFPLGASAAFFTVTLPSAMQYDDMSFIIGFEPSSVTVNATFHPLLASTTTTAGAVWRLTVFSSAGQSSGVSTVGGQMSLFDGAANPLAYLNSGIYSYGGSNTHLCNIVGWRYNGTTISMYLNQGVTLSTDAGTAATGNTTAIYIGRHNTNSTQFSDGYVDFLYVYNSVLSATDLQDSFNAARTAFPLFVNVDWTQPMAIFIGDSTTHGYYTTTDSCWHKKMFITDQATNFPDGQPQFAVFGHSGAGFGTMNLNVWNNIVQPAIPTDAAKVVLYQRGAVNAIRTEGQTAAQTYTACRNCYNDFIAAFPTGTFITDNTGPRTTQNATLESYDTLINAEFTTLAMAPHIYSPDLAGDFPTGAYEVRIRDNTNIGLDGDDTTGVAANWTNTSPDGLTPNNVHNYYFSDAIHHDGTDTANPGQTEYINEILPLYQQEMAPISYGSGIIKIGDNQFSRGFIRQGGHIG